MALNTLGLGSSSAPSCLYGECSFCPLEPESDGDSLTVWKGMPTSLGPAPMLRGEVIP